jgi:acyl carrier protein
MNREEILKKVLHIAAQNNVLYEHEAQEITAETPTRNYLDSLDATELIMLVEKEFDIAVTDAEAEKCKTFGEIAALVEQRIA